MLRFFFIEEEEKILYHGIIFGIRKRGIEKMVEWTSEGKEYIEEKKIELEYYLIREIRKEYIQPIYGIAVEKREDGNCEIETTGGITYSISMVKNTISLLRRCSVTPMSLIEVVDDLIK